MVDKPVDQMSYFEALTAAVDAMARDGYQSPEQLAYWTGVLRRAAIRSLRPEDQVEQDIRDALTATFRKQVDQGAVLRKMPGVQPYTIERVRPELRRELDRRIAASVDLIKLNRPKAIETTLSRFSGWASSLPAGEPGGIDRRETKAHIRKSLASESFEHRRVVIDQGHKLINAINTTVAVGGGALGAFWMSHKNQPGYNGRPDHNARDGRFFLLKGSWADQAGFVKPNSNGYTDDVVQPSVEVFCRCAWVWLFSLRSIPSECLTQKGHDALADAKRKIANAA